MNLALINVKYRSIERGDRYMVSYDTWLLKLYPSYSHGDIGVLYELIESMPAFAHQLKVRYHTEMVSCAARLRANVG